MWAAPEQCPECGRDVAWVNARIAVGAAEVRIRWCPRCGHEERAKVNVRT